MQACRGIIVCYETTRQWFLKLTPSFAKPLKKFGVTPNYPHENKYSFIQLAKHNKTPTQNDKSYLPKRIHEKWRD